MIKKKTIPSGIDYLSNQVWLCGKRKTEHENAFWVLINEKCVFQLNKCQKSYSKIIKKQCFVEFD